MVRKKAEKPKTEREKVEERREEVLAKGRKFRYPLQYAKHRMVVYTILVATAAVVAMSILGWAMLYKVQDTSDMVYRITQILPLPVAKVDGENVRYSDYLMIYKSNIQTAQQQSGQLGNTLDDNMVRETYKSGAMNAAIEYTYAIKLAKERGITVSEEEIDEVFEGHRKVGSIERTRETFLKIVRDNFGMNEREYRRMLYLTLIKARVAQAVDNNAVAIAEQVEQNLSSNGNNFGEIASGLGENIVYEATGQLVDNMNVDGGRANKAMTLENGQVSERFLSSNGNSYYYVKLIDKTDSKVNYESLQINFTKFDEMVVQLYANNLVQKYITIDTI